MLAVCASVRVCVRVLVCWCVRHGVTLLPAPPQNDDLANPAKRNKCRAPKKQSPTRQGLARRSGSLGVAAGPPHCRMPVGGPATVALSDRLPSGARQGHFSRILTNVRNFIKKGVVILPESRIHSVAFNNVVPRRSWGLLTNYMRC